MPIEVKLSPNLTSNAWLSAPYREGYTVVSSGKDLGAHHNRTETKLVPGLSNGEKILQNLACSDMKRLHPAWATNKILLEERISTSIHDIGEIIVENISPKSTNEGVLYILQVSIDLKGPASIKLNKHDPISASFILDASLNLQRILPLIICCERSLYIGINEPEDNHNHPTTVTNLKKLMFNLSNSNQSNSLSCFTKNRKLLEERISTSIHDITLITIEKISIENSDEEEQQVIALSIEINQSHSIMTYFVLTMDFNLENHYVCKSQLVTNQQFHTFQPKVFTAVTKDEKPVRKDASPNAAIDIKTPDKKENIALDERTKTPYIPDTAVPALPDYDKVLKGEVTPAAVQAHQQGIEWIRQKLQILHAPIAIKSVAALIELPTVNPSNHTGNTSMTINKSQQNGTTPTAYSSTKP